MECGSAQLPFRISFRIRRQLLDLQREGVKIVDAGIPQQQRRVIRVQTHPEVEYSCMAESRQVDDSLGFAARCWNTKDGVIREWTQHINIAAIVRPGWKTKILLLQYN